MRHHNPQQQFILVLFVFVGIGCSGSGGLEKVNGKVTLKGQLLDVGTISFLSQEATDGINRESIALVAGKYELPAKQGLKPGLYRVMIISLTQPGPGSKDLIPADYGAKSKQDVEVVKSGPNIFNFDIP